MLDWFNYHGHMCIAFEMLGLSVFDFLVSIQLGMLTLKFVDEFQTFDKIISVTEGQLLSAVPTGTRQAHGLSTLLRCQVFARQQTYAYGSQAGEHSIR